MRFRNQIARVVWLVATLLLFACAVSAQAQPRTLTIPFESHNGLIFLCTTLNKKPALLLLDTGANVSIAFKDGTHIVKKPNLSLS